MKFLKGKIYSVNISEKCGTIKKPVDSIAIGEEGVIGDSHYGKSSKHVSVMSKERIDEFAKEVGREIEPGEFAENITTIGLNLQNVRLHDQIKIGKVLVEVIQIGKDEEVGTNKVFRIIGKVVMVHEGLFCKVLKEGNVLPGDEVELILYQLVVSCMRLNTFSTHNKYEIK